MNNTGLLHYLKQASCGLSSNLVAMDRISASPALAASAAALILWLCWKVFLEPSVLPDLPIVGLDQGQWFAWPRTLYRSFHSFRDIYEEAYKKVSHLCRIPYQVLL